ncbi:protein of unknown function DUF559 [Cyanobacterium sp. HL-69]|uniref:endonuclease domain-containing protein n=1 Tax=Cyanobacterium sp. HL-69 TaxID=2054282 RepID=UPI000CA3C911|nr:protein of unknown function DUF559 [Cyanobacterium sp. HL-69]
MTDFFLPYNQKLIPRAKELRKNMTPAEKKLWSEYLRNAPLKFMRQSPIDNFIVDFYCAQARLIIEIDGEIHQQDNAIIYDKERTAILESYGLKVIRFTNHQVLNNFPQVCNTIQKHLIRKSPPY